MDIYCIECPLHIHIHENIISGVCMPNISWRCILQAFCNQGGLSVVTGLSECQLGCYDGQYVPQLSSRLMLFIATICPTPCASSVNPSKKTRVTHWYTTHYHSVSIIAPYSAFKLLILCMWHVHMVQMGIHAPSCTVKHVACSMYAEKNHGISLNSLAARDLPLFGTNSINVF